MLINTKSGERQFFINVIVKALAAVFFNYKKINLIRIKYTASYFNPIFKFAVIFIAIDIYYFIKKFSDNINNVKKFEGPAIINITIIKVFSKIINNKLIIMHSRIERT